MSSRTPGSEPQLSYPLFFDIFAATREEADRAAAEVVKELPCEIEVGDVGAAKNVRAIFNNDVNDLTFHHSDPVAQVHVTIEELYVLRQVLGGTSDSRLKALATRVASAYDVLSDSK